MQILSIQCPACFHFVFNVNKEYKGHTPKMAVVRKITATAREISPGVPEVTWLKNATTKITAAIARMTRSTLPMFSLMFMMKRFCESWNKGIADGLSKE